MSPPAILTSVDQPEYNLIIKNLLIIIMSTLSRRFVAHNVGSSNNFIKQNSSFEGDSRSAGQRRPRLYETQRIKPTVSAGGRDNVVGTATRSRAGQWVQVFRTRPVGPPSPLSLTYNRHRVPFPKVKRPG